MNGSMWRACAVAAALLAVPGFGASVSFDPPSASVEAGTAIVVDVTATPQAGTPYNYGSLLFGSNDAAGFNFAYDPDWSTAFNQSMPAPEYDGVGVYLHEVQVGGQSSAPLSLPSLSLGSLTIDTTGMAEGPHVVRVDATLDGFISVFRFTGGEGDPDPAYGTFSFTIVPEPGTVAFAVLGVLTLLRRKP